ncbi:MAG: hypothetical protein ACTSVM_06975 [Candidatus Ranarchaeia archaeon]
MIHGVWVIDRTGHCLFHWNYGSEILDPTLFSGFFSALFNFAKEIGQSHIENVKMSDLSFSCLLSKGLLFVVSSDKTEDNSYLLRTIRDKFFKQFENRYYLLGDLLRETSDEVKQFKASVDSFLRKLQSDASKEDIPYSLVPARSGSLIQILTRGTPFREKLIERFGIDGIDVIIAVDGHRSIRELANITNVSIKKVLAIVRFGLESKVLVDITDSDGRERISNIIQQIVTGETELETAIKNLGVLLPDDSNRLHLIQRIKGLQTTFSDLNHELQRLSKDKAHPNMSTLNDFLSSTAPNTIYKDNIRDQADTDLNVYKPAFKPSPGLLGDADIDVSTKPHLDNCRICSKPVYLTEESTDEIVVCKKCKTVFHLGCATKFRLPKLRICYCPLCGRHGLFSPKKHRF